MLTARLEVRLPREGDRARFVELFGDDDFMVFFGGALDAESASMRFDGMLQRGKESPFAKQPVVERSSGVIVGYSGVDWFDFEGEQRLELGYRLVPQARGMGYATEASLAVLSVAAQTFQGELLTIIHPDNVASINVSEKLGFAFWKQARVDGHLRNISRRPVPAPARAPSEAIPALRTASSTASTRPSNPRCADVCADRAHGTGHRDHDRL